MTKKIVLLVISLCILFMFCACGARLKTNLVINPDGSGYREINATISSSDMNSLNGGAPALDKVINESKPDFVEITKSSGDNGSTNYLIKYTFKNIQEYTEKTRKLTKKEATIKLDKEGSIFSSKNTFSEDITPYDTVKWALDAVVNAKMTTYSSDSLYENAGMTVKISGKDANGGLGNYQNQINYPVREINVTTKLDDKKAFNRTITYKVDKAVEDGIGKGNLKSYLQSLVPDGGQLNIGVDGQASLYNISFKAANSVKLNEMTLKATKINSGFSFNDDKDTSSFKPIQTIKDSISFKSIVLNSKVDNGINYKLELPSKYSFTALNNTTLPQKAQDNFKVGNFVINKANILTANVKNSTEITYSGKTYYTSIILYVLSAIGLLLLLGMFVIISMIAVKRSKKQYALNHESVLSSENTIENNRSIADNETIQGFGEAAASTNISYMEMSKGVVQNIKDLPNRLPQILTVENIKEFGKSIFSSKSVKYGFIASIVSIVVCIIVSFIVSLIYNFAIGCIVKSSSGPSEAISMITNFLKLKFWQLLFAGYQANSYCEVSSNAAALGIMTKGQNLYMILKLPMLLFLLIPYIGSIFAVKFATNDIDKSNNKEILRRIGSYVLINSILLSILSLILKTKLTLFSYGDNSIFMNAGYSFFDVLIKSLFFGALLSLIAQYKSVHAIANALLANSRASLYIRSIWAGAKKGLIASAILFLIGIILVPFVGGSAVKDAAKGTWKSSYGLGYVITAPNLISSIFTYSNGVTFGIDTGNKETNTAKANKTTDNTSDKTIEKAIDNPQYNIITSFKSNALGYILLFIPLLSICSGVFYLMMRIRNKVSIKEIFIFSSLYSLLIIVIGQMNTINLKSNLFEMMGGLMGKSPISGDKIVIGFNIILPYIICFVLCSIVSFIFSKIIYGKDYKSNNQLSDEI